MGNFLKIKKIKIAIFSFLILNQFLINAYAFNFRKIDLENSNRNNYQKRIKNFKNLFAEKINDEDSFSTKEIEEIEKFVEETFDSNDSDIFVNQIKPLKEINNDNDLLKNEGIKKDIKSKQIQKKDENFNDKSNERNEIIQTYSEQNSKNYLPLPSRSIISSSQFKVPSRGYLNLKGPQITLNLKSADPIETLKLIGKLGNYGIVIVDNNISENNENSGGSKISATFNDVDISDAFNSVLLSADLQAILENNIIFVGKDILTKSLRPKVSKTYRLNQVNAASVADYLSTLGAQISKVMLISGSIEGTEVGDSFVNKKEINDDAINSYGIKGGPLSGLIGTADLRLQTITLIGSKDLIKTAEKYLKSLDVRHRQVALNIKIIDVTLTKNDIKNNIFELRTGETRIINNSGLSLVTGNMDPFEPLGSENIKTLNPGDIIPVPEGNIMNWLEAKIVNENAKILASPTLILGENPNILSSGAASVDEGLDSASIGRPYKNEGFIKVGETVVTGFTQSNDDGVVTCTAEEGTAGITFGAKVDKIDDNGFVTFALSPAISSVTRSVEISGCGIQNTLSVRQLDTGSIRVRNGDTLILTGVLQDADNITTSKVPILGDIPLLGSLFRNNSTQKRKSELIILVTPKILKDK
ncbi:putative proteinral (type II) secretion pathway protein D precursor [Prochlorococcus marinus str. MIT 9201]|uniref:Type II/III secretion system secretin-like domain-containing protein n=1 Tax=Prochlorococcus marinus str. MIT 9201 TaxID=93057 RepID=A0A0A2A5G4_PROMR|nr:putative proteinral (type II) secretion pathway protein D precursor [Prochlorococcus marinus str. MIT 9201]